MAYDVTKTNGDRLTIVADRTVDTTSPIKLIGKNYSGYGEIMAENLVALLENFSNAAAPTNPVEGQLWWNSADQILNVRASSSWIGIGGKTGVEVARIKDTAGNFHNAIKFNAVNNAVSPVQICVAIISSDNQYVPHNDTGLASAFPTIGRGINLNRSGTNPYDDYKLRGRAIEAEFADMAEIYRSDVELVPGNLVILGGDREITKTSCAFDDQVFGVISTAPGFLLNAKEKMSELAYPVALKGRVPCLVKGSIRQGQRIVASDIPGVGMAADKYDPFAIIGRAITGKAESDVGYVEVAVGIK
jgi:hypothetical protein